MRTVDLDKKIRIGELSKMAKDLFGDLVKGVVDISRDRMAIDAELRADEEAFLIERGSDPVDLWGINMYPEPEGDDFVEFDSMTNLRPSRGNCSRGA